MFTAYNIAKIEEHKMKVKNFIIMLFAALIFSVNGEDNEKIEILSNATVNNGIVIINNKYIAPPYTIKAEKHYKETETLIQVKINSIVLLEHKSKISHPRQYSDVEQPASITAETSFNSEEVTRYILDKTQYIRENIPIENQKKKLLEMYQKLPNVKIESSDINSITILYGKNYEKKLMVLIKSRPNLTPSELENEILSYCNRLTRALNRNSIFIRSSGFGESTRDGSINNFLRLKQHNKELLLKRQPTNREFPLFVPSNELDERLENLLKREDKTAPSILPPLKSVLN